LRNSTRESKREETQRQREEKPSGKWLAMGIRGLRTKRSDSRREKSQYLSKVYSVGICDARRVLKSEAKGRGQNETSSPTLSARTRARSRFQEHGELAYLYRKKTPIKKSEKRKKEHPVHRNWQSRAQFCPRIKKASTPDRERKVIPTRASIARRGGRTNRPLRQGRAVNLPLYGTDLQPKGVKIFREEATWNPFTLD